MGQDRAMGSIYAHPNGEDLGLPVNHKVIEHYNAEGGVPDWLMGDEYLPVGTFVLIKKIYILCIFAANV